MVDSGPPGPQDRAGWYRYDDGPHRPDDPAPPPAAAGAVRARAGIEASVRWVALPDLERARLVEIARLPSTTPESWRPPGATSPRSASTSSARRATRPGSCSAGSCASSSTRPASPSARASARAEDLDTALRLGFNHPRGPFEWLREIGPGTRPRHARRAWRTSSARIATGRRRTCGAWPSSVATFPRRTRRRARGPALRSEVGADQDQPRDPRGSPRSTVSSSRVTP